MDVMGHVYVCQARKVRGHAICVSSQESEGSCYMCGKPGRGHAICALSQEGVMLYVC